MSKKSTSKKSKKVTPLMQQYFDLKAKHPGAIMLFRVGDFYETFGEDAVKVSAVLGIVLTSRNNGGSDIELAGFPHHSVNVYLPKLVKAGMRVAVCEQLEKPSKEKKLVKRGVTDIITPGVAVGDQILDHKSNNFLCSIYYAKKGPHGISFLDISTGEFLVSEGDTHHIEKLIQSFLPAEIIFSKSNKETFVHKYGDDYYIFPLDDWVYAPDFTREQLTDHFKVTNFKGFGINHMDAAIIAAGATMHYLEITENKNKDHITRISRIQHDDFIWIDSFTIRNLELIRPSHPTGMSLLEIMDRTVSPMGARLMKRWILMPLIDLTQIQNRLDTVSYLINDLDVSALITQKLKKIGDLERLISKVSMEKILPKELVHLKDSQLAINELKDAILACESPSIQMLGERLQLCTDLIDVITKHILDEPAVHISKSGVIADGVDPELDDLRNTVKNSKDLLLEIQTAEAEKTGITNLKIGFNNVFGYYLEVTNKYKNQGLVPDYWVRKQTLTGSERYITDELKKLETKILTAQDSISAIELRLYHQLIQDLKAFISPIQQNATLLATLDCLNSFATIAIHNQYCKPTINDSLVLDIKNGRHPVIEQQLTLGEDYVPNDTYLSNEEQQIMMITGPNMSGKSAVLRQTALICLMAQTGSYVPASEVTMGYIDKLFTRVGASDNISSGESTFMIEMNETASIMNNISPRSLILLDEIGRGTSTYDGISIAWSLAEYLHNNTEANPKTLFATHYHELNDLASRLTRIRNYNVATKEIDNKVLFLRKLKEGGSKHSFGIHVAKMAGMPKEIVLRANEILLQLETKSKDEGTDHESMAKHIANAAPQYQLQLFNTDDPTLTAVKEALQNIDLNGMTPIECMMKLNELVKMMGDG